MQTKNAIGNTIVNQKQPVSGYYFMYRLKLLALALPIVGFVIVFSYVPMFGWSYAFVDYIPGIPVFEQSFAGLKYFRMLFSGGGDFINVMRNTLVMSFLVIFTMPVPVIFAIMLSRLRSIALSRFVQTVSSLPYFVSFILIYALFFVMFSSEDGVINRLLMSFGWISEPANLLGNSDIAWIVQTFVCLFKNTGYTAIIYIAAISGIDTQLYDAADVDGAGEFQKIWHITLPGISSTFFVMLLLSIAGMLTGAGFEQYFVFQNPLVIEKLEVLDTYTYKIGLTMNEYSFATAVGIFKSVVSITLLFSANLLSKKVMGRPII